MNYDIVGTLTQPYIALRALLFGAIVGLVCAILKLIFGEKKKYLLVIGDILSSTLYGLSNLLFSFYYTKGVVWAYTLLCTTISFCVVYLAIKMGAEKLNLKLKKSD